jgi:hypothetical protein
LGKVREGKRTKELEDDTCLPSTSVRLQVLEILELSLWQGVANVHGELGFFGDTHDLDVGDAPLRGDRLVLLWDMVDNSAQLL